MLYNISKVSFLCRNPFNKQKTECTTLIFPNIFKHTFYLYFFMREKLLFRVFFLFSNKIHLTSIYLKSFLRKTLQNSILQKKNNRSIIETLKVPEKGPEIKALSSTVLKNVYNKVIIQLCS